jgi:hypothetical protein
MPVSKSLTQAGELADQTLFAFYDPKVLLIK